MHHLSGLLANPVATSDLGMCRVPNLVIRWHSPVVGEAEVVVLLVEQSAGGRVVLAHHRVQADSGRGEADLSSRVVEPNLRIEGIGAEGVSSGSDRAGYQPLHRYEHVSDLGGPVPFGNDRTGWSRGCVGPGCPARNA